MKRAMSVLLAVAAAGCSGGTKASSPDLSAIGGPDGGVDLQSADDASAPTYDLSMRPDSMSSDMNTAACEACLMAHCSFVYNACINDSTCTCWLSCSEANAGNYAKCAVSCPMPDDTTGNLGPCYLDCLPCPDTSRPPDLDGGFTS
jgi:hypothetical protein